LGLRRSWTEPDIYKPELYSTLAPYVKHSANQPDLTYLVVLEMEIVQSAKFQEIMDKLLRSMTATFIKNLEKIFTFFEPGGGPMALLNSGAFVQVPSLTRAGDTIYTFKNRDETFILRPESGKEDPESDAYIVKDLRDCGECKRNPGYTQRPRHFKYASCDNRVWAPGRFFIERRRLKPIVVLH
jgi:hypothetical protein